MMRLELVKRPQRSALFSALSPFIAFALTIIAGAILFALLGVNPLTAFRIYFIEPISQVWQLHELAIKAAPLILIAVGLSVCYKANIWNIGAEGQFIFGAIFGSAIPVLFPQFEGPLVLPLMLLLGMVGGAAYAAIPAFLKTRFNTNEILTSLMLVYVAQLFLDVAIAGVERSHPSAVAADHRLEILVAVAQVDGEVVLARFVPGERVALGVAAESDRRQVVREPVDPGVDVGIAEMPVTPGQERLVGDRPGDGAEHVGKVEGHVTHDSAHDQRPYILSLAVWSADS